MSNVDNLISIIRESPLSEKTKEYYADKIAREGATRENLSAVRKLLEEMQSSAFANLGLTIDLSDPDLKAAEEAMRSEVNAATERYVSALKKLEMANKRIADDISGDLAQLEQLVIAGAQAEA